MKQIAFAFLLAVALPALGAEELISSAVTAKGEAVPYVLDMQSAQPHYIVILFPGGTGIVDPHLEDGRLVYQAKNNFLLRSRPYLVDAEFAAVLTNASRSEERMQALLNDLQRRFPKAKVYLMGTSRGTDSTLALAEYLSTRIAGEIHTSSLAAIRDLDAGKYKNRQLMVHHREDACRVTPFSAAEAAHEKFGTELIVVEGGQATGNPCQPFGHHGYNGVEKDTMERIKAWIKQGDK